VKPLVIAAVIAIASSLVPVPGTTYNIVDTLTGKTLYYHVSYRDQATQRSFDALCRPSEGCLGADEFQKRRAELFGDLK
jgi:hypothetical protein